MSRSQYEHAFPWSTTQVAIAPDGAKVVFELTQEAMVEPPRWWWLLALFRRSETQGRGWSLKRTERGAESQERFERWDDAIASLRTSIEAVERGVS